MAENQGGNGRSTHFVAVKMRADVKVEEQHGGQAQQAAKQIDGTEGVMLRDVTARGDAQPDAHVP